MKSKLIPIAMTGLCLNMARADFNPVALTPGSYTLDIVVPANTVQAVPYCINVTAGNGTGLGDNSYYEQGLRPGNNSGIPAHNTVFTNINNSAMSFLMPPTYATNNTLMIDSTFTSGTFTFNTPTTASSLAILGAGGGGATTIGYTVTHADSTTDTGTTVFPDWFNGGATVAWGANGRMDTGGNYNNFNSSSVNNNAPYFYGNTITVSSGSPIVSISFTFSAGAHANIVAISGSSNGTSYQPVPVGGFNVMAIIPATVPFPVNATMDTGTNITTYEGNMNTWFEQGFLRGSSVGLPPSGSVFNSFAQPTHHYQMGSYSTNNAVLIDTNHLTATIVPASPAIYTSFAFLTAGANNSTPMQNSCILQHADGVSETNTFFGYDWFYGSAPGAIAWKANGRVNMSNRTLNNVSNNTPYLFESYFTLSDLTSPVTNIVVKYKSASGANSTTYIMALSASTNPVAPLITGGPVPLQQAWYTTQTATMTVQEAGSLPLTNQWMVERNGTYVPLTDGTDANGSIVSGSGTTTLTINNLSVLDGTNYEFIAANSAGSATSLVASVSIRTGIAGVVAITNWNNIANTTYPIGNFTNIFSSDKSLTATLTLLNGQSTNGYASGITGDGANASLMDGYMDTRFGGGTQPTINIDGLNGSSYNVILYAFGDTGRPSNDGTDGVPNWAVNGAIYYAPTLGGTTATKFNATSTSIGGTGFNGFVQATILSANDFTNDIPAADFGNYIVISNVVPSSGEIQIIPNADFSSFRSPLNGIELVDTSTPGDNFGIHFLGTTTDAINGKPVAPIIDSQSPSNTLDVLTNHAVVSTFSVTVDGLVSPPIAYQWYVISAANVTSLIPGATNSTLVNVDTNNKTLYCVVTNLAGSVTSIPVAINIVIPGTPSGYAAAVLALHPVAYWPLGETSGNIAFDYAGTNDGVYNGNYQLGQTGLPPTPGVGANTSVHFDGSSAYVDIPSSGGTGDLNITGPSTIMEWVLVPGTAEPGFGTALGHSDQGYRLSVVNASGDAAQPRYANPGPDVLGGSSIADGNWHQMVGVYDGTSQILYVDGKLAGSSPASTAPPGNADDVMIAAAPDYLGARNFQGNIAQVAIYNTALTAAQVIQIYGAVDTAPVVSITPVNPSTYSGNNVTLTANLSGTPATKLQWFYIDTASNSNNIAGATGSTYTIVAPPASFNGYTFGVIAGNAYGTNIATTTLTVSTAPATLTGDVGPAFGEAYVGAPAVYTVFATGSLPINYQWTLNGLPINGATNASVTLATPCGTNVLQVSFTNELSAGTPVISSQATLVGDATPPVITFNTNGTSWQLQGVGVTPSIGTNILELTDNAGGEASSAFYVTAQYVGGFNASFIYTAGGNDGADGTCFVIQNNGAGTNSLGGGGGELGYGGITNSVALQINLYQSVGIAFGTNGGTYGNGGNPYITTAPVYVNSEDPILVNLNWTSNTLTVNMTDTATHQTFSTNYVVGPVSTYTGSSLGYVGFTGGDGGATSIQTVRNFQFQSVVPPISLSAASGAGRTVVLSWPAADPNYVLQTNTSLSLPNNWGNGPTPVTANGVDKVTINVGGGSTQVFYRLQREVCQ